MADFGARLKHAWNAFTKPEEHTSWDLGTSYSVRPDRIRSYVSNERSIITAIYNRISIDAAGATFVGSLFLTNKAYNIHDRNQYARAMQLYWFERGVLD